MHQVSLVKMEDHNQQKHIILWMDAIAMVAFMKQIAVAVIAVVHHMMNYVLVVGADLV
jgi:hypothetical protein